MARRARKRRRPLFQRAVLHALKKLATEHPGIAVSLAGSGAAYAIKSVGKDISETAGNTAQISGDGMHGTSRTEPESAADGNDKGEERLMEKIEMEAHALLSPEAFGTLRAMKKLGKIRFFDDQIAAELLGADLATREGQSLVLTDRGKAAHRAMREAQRATR